MDVLVAEAVLEFGGDLRNAVEALPGTRLAACN
jgi:hypothetical protein